MSVARIHVQAPVGAGMTRIKTVRWKWLRLCSARERARLLRGGRVQRAGSLASGFENEILVAAPVEMSLGIVDQHHRTTRFIEKIRDAYRTPGRALCIDFSRTDVVVAGAMLLFYAELSQLRSMFARKAIRCIPPRNPKMREVLQHLGIFQMLGYRSDVVPQARDVVTWRKASALDANGQLAGELLELYGTLQAGLSKFMFRGVTEALTNVVQHAYIANRQDGLPRERDRRWWMFCREGSDRMYVCVCDLGIGIPRSLPAKYSLEMLDKALGFVSGGRMHNDARLIHAGMEIARSRTGSAARGKGLADLRRVVDEVDGGRLYVFSNRGLVLYTQGSYQTTNFENSILGTLIVWTLPLKESSNDQ